MTNEFYGLHLEDIRHDNEPIQDWTREEIGGALFFWRHIYEDPEQTPGFRAKAIVWHTEDDEGIRYKTILECTAYFDGVRHLYFGEEKDDCLGYLYYPDMETLVALLARIREMEKHFLRVDD